MKSSRVEEIKSVYMLGLAMMIGILGGFAALAFHLLFSFIHNFAFLGQMSFVYLDKIHTPASPWGIGIIFVPVVGSFIVTWIMEKFAATERGLSIAQIMYEIHYHEGETLSLT